MKRQNSGKVINISSMTAFKKYVLPEGQGFLHYVASKAAVVGLTRGLAIEMGPYNICVNTVAPEYIPTGIWEDDVDGYVIEERIFKRTQTPEDMVGVVLFLAGAGSDMITGQTIMVNGGNPPPLIGNRVVTPSATLSRRDGRPAGNQVPADRERYRAVDRWTYGLRCRPSSWRQRAGPEASFRQQFA